MKNKEQFNNNIFCAICGKKIDSFSETIYPNLVCKNCDKRAININGEHAKHCSEYPDAIKYAREYYKKTGTIIMPDDDGDNPVFIDGKKCWRRYRFGGWITMLGKHNCKDISEFYKKIKLFGFSWCNSIQ